MKEEEKKKGEEEKKKRGEEQKKREVEEEKKKKANVKREEEEKKKGEEKKTKEEEKKKEKVEKEKKGDEKKKEEEEKEKEKERKEKLSGSNEAVEAVDRAIELDEKIQERRLTLLNMAVQDMKMIDICEDEGVNPKDTFRGFVRDDAGRKRLRIVTLGEEGEGKAKEMVYGLKDSDVWHVKNESVSRVEWSDIEKNESDDEPLIRPMKGVRQRIRKRLAKFE